MWDGRLDLSFRPWNLAKWQNTWIDISRSICDILIRCGLNCWWQFLREGSCGLRDFNSDSFNCCAAMDVIRQQMSRGQQSSQRNMNRISTGSLIQTKCRMTDLCRFHHFNSTAWTSNSICNKLNYIYVYIYFGQVVDVVDLRCIRKFKCWRVDPPFTHKESRQLCV